jgi:hypothetical protein
VTKYRLPKFGRGIDEEARSLFGDALPTIRNWMRLNRQWLAAHLSQIKNPIETLDLLYWFPYL